MASGRYATDVVPGWDIAGNANGGYLVALAARAMAHSVGRPPLTLTAHYLAPGKPGPAEVHVDVVRAGRSLGVGTPSYEKIARRFGMQG